MKNFLETILARKREEVRERKRSIPESTLRKFPEHSRSVRSLRAALTASVPSVIAEIKKASPSKGIIRNDFDHRTIARQYAGGGAAAVSVLTDRDFFQGDISFLDDLSPTVSIPILRKDFIVDSYQVHESKAHGADAILLIAAALDAPHLAELHEEARALGLECLVEIHTAEEIESLRGVDVQLVGINNRDLATFTVDRETSVRLKSLLPPSVHVVSESGILSPSDGVHLFSHGIGSFLIGEAFMRAGDPGAALSQFLRETRTACLHE